VHGSLLKRSIVAIHIERHTTIGVYCAYLYVRVKLVKRWTEAVTVQAPTHKKHNATLTPPHPKSFTHLLAQSHNLFRRINLSCHHQLTLLLRALPPLPATKKAR
jgi:hypothetical protein